jgi:hypothetical protein
MKAQADNACYVTKDATACMNLNYNLAAAIATANGPNGAVTQDINRKKARGSIQEWLQPPVPYAPVQVTNANTAAVAVTMGAASAAATSGAAANPQ